MDHHVAGETTREGVDQPPSVPEPRRADPFDAIDALAKEMGRLAAAWTRNSQTETGGMQTEIGERQT